MNMFRKESYDFHEDIETRINTLEDELLRGYKLSWKPWFEFIQKSFERIIRQFYTVISVSNIDIMDIEELEEKKHRTFTMLAEMSEKESKTLDIWVRTLDYVIAANDEIFRKFQDEKFAHAHKKVYQNPKDSTIKDLLQEDMKNTVISLFEYRKNHIRNISVAQEETQKAVEKIARLHLIPELNADLMIREAANDMIFEQIIQESNNNRVEERENKDQKIEVPKIWFFAKMKATMKKWF